LTHSGTYDLKEYVAVSTLDFCRLNKRAVTHMRQLVAVFSPRKPGFHTATLLREVYGYLPVI